MSDDPFTMTNVGTMRDSLPNRVMFGPPDPVNGRLTAGLKFRRIVYIIKMGGVDGRRGNGERGEDGRLGRGAEVA